MKKTLLLVFIHGFKGGENTFATFPEHIRVLLSHALPKLSVVSLVYPRFETRGHLDECVGQFKEWYVSAPSADMYLLQNKVIDLEVANGTPSPTIDPSVRTILVGHSMGGIVAADTLLSIARDQPVPLTSTHPHASANSSTVPADADSTSARQASSSTGNLLAPPSPPHDPAQRSSSAPPTDRRTASPGDGTLFFPYIQAILAFDTPYLGISPGVLAHGAEEHWNTATAAYSAYTSASSLFGRTGAKTAQQQQRQQPVDASKMLPAPANGTAANTNGQPVWQKLGKYALLASGAAAVAAAGSAAYANRQQLSAGWAWASSHLEFVGCLARARELQRRVDGVVALCEGHGLGFADFYTALGGEVVGKTRFVGQVLGRERTFCNVPEEGRGADGDGDGGEGGGEGTREPGSKRRRMSGEKEEVDEKKQKKKKKKKEKENAKKSDAPSNRKLRGKGTWIRCTNEKASTETWAHVSMFQPRENPGYYAMSERAKESLLGWIDGAWYESATETGEGGWTVDVEVEGGEVGAGVDGDVEADAGGDGDGGFGTGVGAGMDEEMEVEVEVEGAE
ncbi:hypothetical protein LTR28_006976 [Elasticomyces elasticus]|nr:hypothetical protein LTR28_006976 [Elasticomyces elasticus]